VWCSALLSDVAMCCRVLQSVARCEADLCRYAQDGVLMLQCVAVFCSVHSITGCGTELNFQCVVVCCRELSYTGRGIERIRIE